MSKGYVDLRPEATGCLEPKPYQQWNRTRLDTLVSTHPPFNHLKQAFDDLEEIRDEDDCESKDENSNPCYDGEITGKEIL